MIPLYLAGASRELERVVPVVKALERSCLVRITHRWFDDVAAWGVGRDHELTTQQKQEHALADLMGVAIARIVWVLWPEQPSMGAPLEFGYALAAGEASIHTVVSGPAARHCIFTTLADQRFDSDEDALLAVLSFASDELRSRPTIEVPPVVGTGGDNG